MGRWLARLGLWLGLIALAAAGVAHGQTATIRSGAPGKFLVFQPPPGWCFLPPTDPRFRDLALRDGDGGRVHVHYIFADCAEVAGGVPLIRRWGAVETADPLPYERIADEKRAQWLRDRRDELVAHPLPRTTPDRLTNAVLYERFIQTATVGGANYVDVAMNAITIRLDTIVVIDFHRTIGVDEPLALVRGLDELRPLAEAAMGRFAEDNDLFLDTAVSPEQEGFAVPLGVLLATLLVGSTLVVAVQVRRLWLQILLSEAIMLTEFAVFGASAGQSVFTRTNAEMLLGFVLLDVPFVLLAAGALKLLSLVSVKGVDLRERLRAALSPDRWPTIAPLKPGGADFAKRWFVTVSAATGSVVATMLGEPRFWEHAGEALSPSKIAYTVVITVVSITLIGPVEEYIFETRLGATGQRGHPVAGDHPVESRFEHLVELASPRAFGRFLLVLVFILQLTVLHGAIELRLHEGDLTSTLTVVLASLVPGIVTFYWCAALQRGARSVAARSAGAATLLGSLLLGLPFLTVLMPLFMLIPTPTAPDRQGYKTAANWLMLGLGVLTIGVFVATSFFGGLALDFARRRRFSPVAAVAAVGAILVAVVLAALTVAGAVLTALDVPLFPGDLAPTRYVLLPILGWAVGLIVSGFPDVLRAGRRVYAAEPETAAPTWDEVTGV